MAHWSWLMAAGINLGLLGLSGVAVVDPSPLEATPEYRCSFRDPPLDLTLTPRTPDCRFWGPVLPDDAPFRTVFYLEADGSYCRYCLKQLGDCYDGKVVVLPRPGGP